MNITTKPQDSDGWGKVGRVLCLVAAAVCLIASLYLALTDKVAAGTLVAGLFVVLVLFYYLPQLESFKAYGIEAKLRERVHEAEAILGKLRGTAFAQARLTYHTLGWGSRMGDPGAR